MIEARHVSKRYGPTLAVDDLSSTVAAGQVTGFLGPNGSGKSTTMRMIVGLDAPSSGEITDHRPFIEAAGFDPLLYSFAGSASPSCPSPSGPRRAGHDVRVRPPAPSS